MSLCKEIHTVFTSLLFCRRHEDDNSQKCARFQKLAFSGQQNKFVVKINDSEVVRF